MTNEEATRVIEVAKAECEWNAPLDYQTAFDMAIEALKAQPKHDQNTPQKQPDLETLGVKTGKTCADAISRQDAIEELSYLQTYLFDSRDHDNKVSLEDVRYAIEQLPSAKPKQRWIPCSERLPEEDTEVLISYCYKEGEGDTYHVNIDITSYGTTCFGGREIHTLKEWRQPFDYFHANYEVIAWMPLPEPYRAKRRADE